MVTGTSIGAEASVLRALLPDERVDGEGVVVLEGTSSSRWLAAATDALNRGSFEKILNIYEGGEKPFAMIICDIDIFKQVNDLHGHAVGDLILKKVARLLTTTFRSIDYVCRIGGDEFAVIMVDVGRELSHTVRDKIELINDALSNPTDGLPAVSLSAGVAFTDRENPGESIFRDADQALYRVKQNGKHDCGFY